MLQFSLQILSTEISMQCLEKILLEILTGDWKKESKNPTRLQRQDLLSSFCKPEVIVTHTHLLLLGRTPSSSGRFTCRNMDRVYQIFMAGLLSAYELGIPSCRSLQTETQNNRY